MRRYCITVMAFFIAFAAYSYCFAQSDAVNQGTGLSGRVENGVRIIEIKASKYKFDPDPITVKLGEKVRIIATSTDVPHGLSLPEFYVNLNIKPGQTSTTEFTADKEGEFSEYCSIYCGQGHMGMRGKLIVVK